MLLAAPIASGCSAAAAVSSTAAAAAAAVRRLPRLLLAAAGGAVHKLASLQPDAEHGDLVLVHIDPSTGSTQSIATFAGGFSPDYEACGFDPTTNYLTWFSTDNYGKVTLLTVDPLNGNVIHHIAAPDLDQSYLEVRKQTFLSLQLTAVLHTSCLFPPTELTRFITDMHCAARV